MGYNSGVLNPGANKKRSIVEEMESHPNWIRITPNKGESPIQFALRYAAMLISPPQEDGESYDLECVDIKAALLSISDQVEQAYRSKE